jgi:sulfur carrier protein ThiS
MHVSVRFIPRGDPPQRIVELPEGATCADLLKRLDTHPDLVLTVCGETPIPLNAPLTDGDEIKLVHVVSGGT